MVYKGVPALCILVRKFLNRAVLKLSNLTKFNRVVLSPNIPPRNVDEYRLD
jgi:hypothetical protein